MWDREIRAMVSAHAVTAASVLVGTVAPVLLLPGFSVYGTHLAWLCSVSGAVGAVTVVVFWILGVAPAPRRHGVGHKVL